MSPKIQERTFGGMSALVVRYKVYNEWSRGCIRQPMSKSRAAERDKALEENIASATPPSPGLASTR